MPATDKTVAVVLPTLNAGGFMPELIAALAAQTLRPNFILLIDSSSTDETVELARSAAWAVEVIPRRSFRHGATRRRATSLVKADIYVLFTQDALPASPDAIERLVGALDADPDLGMAFGRHLPRPGCSPIAAHNRLFNYPSESQIKRLRDVGRLGLKTCFASDVFAAYKAEVLSAVGSFPDHVIGCEDVYVAARMLKAGYAVGYAADAQVFHSHDNSLLKDFKVFFDIGSFYAHETWILAEFGQMEGEGVRYLKSELSYLRENGLSRLAPLSILALGTKYLGFLLGKHCMSLPRWLCRTLSSFPGYWDG